MEEVRYAVVPNGQAWKLSRAEQDKGFYETQDAAIEAARSAVAMEPRGVPVYLDVLERYGELRRIRIDA